MLTAFAALSAACAGLDQWRLIGPQKPADSLSVVATLFGLVYLLCNIFGQDRFDGFPVGNVLGPGVRGWFVLRGLIFLLAFAIPPAVASFMKPSSPAQLGLWSGWLLATFVRQISDAPVDGFQAAYVLYLTWLCWTGALACTIILALRRAQARQAPRAGQQAPQQPVRDPWQPF
ncbi:MAG TPA: hypothetical protein VFQ44_07725 [Streptosporangiaceae bacterium]|nr:hypothetical protein [Streptosporangiaceae bacterium]